MIGSCDNCNRNDVPVAHHETVHGDTTQCFICTASPWEKDPDPDPYGELDPNYSIERRRNGWALVENRSGHSPRTVSVHPNETAAARALNMAVFGRAA
jgi:hypothetical protein